MITLVYQTNLQKMLKINYLVSKTGVDQSLIDSTH